MAENKTQKTQASVSDFLDSIDDEQKRADCKKIAQIMEKVTGDKPDMWGTSIVGFGRFPYTYASGQSGEWFKVGFSPRKQNITCYIMTGFGELPDTDDYNPQPILDKLGKHSTGKSCLYIKRLSDIDEATLTELIEYSARYAEVFMNSR